MPDAGEHVIERARVRGGKPDAVGRHERHTKRGAEIDERRKIRRVRAAEVTLQLDPDLLPAEGSHESIDQPADAVPLGVERFAANERDEAARLSRQIFERDARLALGRPEFRARDDPAELAIPLGRRDEHGQGPATRGLSPLTQWD